MGIFSRLTDIVNSNLNAIMDRAEDPEKIIRMVIQEMEDTVVEVRSSAARAIADQKDVQRKLKKLNAIQSDWEAKAELAISKGREDLAKAALIEKSKAADMAAHLDEELAHLAEALERSEEDVLKLDAKLREAKAKRATINARHNTASNHLRVRTNLHDNRIGDAFERFDKVDARIDRLEAEAEAYDIGGKTVLDEFAAMEADQNVSDELEALKKRMAKSAEKPSAKPATKSGGKGKGK